MTPPIPIPPAPPAVRQQARDCKPFALIFAAYPAHRPESVQEAIERLRADRKRIDVANVGALIGRIPMPPPVNAAEPPPMTAEQEAVELRQMQRTAEQVSAKPKDRLAEKIARCMNRPPLTDAQEAAYQADLSRCYYFKDGHTERLVQGWGYLPSANRYERECRP